MEDLLKAAIRDPFVDLDKVDPTDPPPIWRWYQHLVEHFPLLTFQRWKYQGFNDEQRPTTHPLSLIVSSICGDEAPLAGSPFLSHLNARRMELAKALTYGVFTSCHPTERESWPGFKAAADVPEMSDEEGWSYSLYEQVGRDLCFLIDDVRGATTKSARKAEMDALDVFLKDVGARRAARRPTIGPSTKTFKALDSEAKTLLALAWRVFGENPSERSSAILTSFGVIDLAHERIASARLALPVLSAVEMDAFSAQPAVAASLRTLRPTARRCAIHLMAHRLGIPEMTIAPKVGAGNDLAYYEVVTNPILG